MSTPSASQSAVVVLSNDQPIGVTRTGRVTFEIGAVGGLATWGAWRCWGGPSFASFDTESLTEADAATVMGCIRSVMAVAS